MPRSIPIGVFGEDGRVIEHDIKVVDIKLSKDNPELFNITWNWLHTPAFTDWGMNDTDENFYLEVCKQAEVIIICETLIPYFTMALLERSKSFGTHVLLDPGHQSIAREKLMFLNMLKVVRKGVVFTFVGDNDVYDSAELGKESLAANTPAGPDGIDQVVAGDGREYPGTVSLEDQLRNR